jgi:photosystem II stability/assembly factor-like uncharacterized protein
LNFSSLFRIGLICLMGQTMFAADRWVVQFFHDEDKSALTINDLQFASATRGVAVGYLAEKKKITPTAVVTSDAGKTWSFVTTKEVGLGVFFLNDQSGWMVTDGGIWATDEAGRSWRKIHKRKGLRRIHFVTPEHGWALGAAKTIIETKDGGKSWTKVQAADDLKMNSDFTSFDWVDFAAKDKGIIVGKSRPAAYYRHEVPIWMDPEPSRRRELPTISVFLETKDEGKTWSAQMSSLFGEITRFRLGANGRGLALVEYENYFDWPSEVLRLDLTTGKNYPALRRKDRAITDVALMTDGSGYVAGFQPSGSISYSPVPGPVKVLHSDNLTTWTDMKVDYRAVARRVMLSAVDATHVWMATDTGMILRLAAN